MPARSDLERLTFDFGHVASNRVNRVLIGVSTACVVAALALPFGSRTAVSSSRHAGPESSVSTASVDQVESTRPVAVPILLTVECESSIAVQNVGGAPSVAILVGWETRAAGSAAGACEGPRLVQCSGLIAPGSGWEWRTDVDGMLDGFDRGGSGMIFSFGAGLLSDLGVDLGFEDTVANHMCQALYASLIADCDAYERFRSAYALGQNYAGIPMQAAAGSPLAASILRSCPGSDNPALVANSSYTALAAMPVGADEPYDLRAAPITNRADGINAQTTVFVQNTGDSTAAVTFEYLAEASCEPRGVACGSESIRPGESVTIAGEQCVPEGESGQLRFESDQPLALVIESQGWDMLSSHTGVDADSGGIQLVGAPVHDPQRGVESELTVFNLEAGTGISAEVFVEWLDRRGDPISSTTGSICPGSTAAFQLAMTGLKIGVDVGSVRVTSRNRVRIAANLRQARYADLERRVPREVAITGLQARTIEGSGGIAGAGLLSLPLVSRSSRGRNAELVLSNHHQTAGWTELALLVYDQNALSHVLCRRLGPASTSYVDLNTQAWAPFSMRGHVLVSATWWRHELPEGIDVPNDVSLPDLGVALVDRIGSLAGEPDAPGDELAISLAKAVQVPIPQLDRAAVWPCIEHEGQPAPAATPSPGPSAPVEALAWVPVLRGRTELPGAPECEPSITVHNVGTESSQAVFVGTTRSSVCGPLQEDGFLARCGGLIAPGAEWAFMPAEIPADTRSGVVLSLNEASLADLGVVPPSDQPAAEWICDRINAGSNSDEVRQLILAFETGRMFDSVPMDRVRGGDIEVSVLRDCTIDADLRATSEYVAPIGDVHIGVPGSNRAMVHRYNLMPTLAGHEGRDSRIWIQNVGLECTSITLSIQSVGFCYYGAQLASVLSLPSMQSMSFDPNTVTGPDWIGSLVIESTQPLVVVADHVDSRSPSAMTSRVAETSSLPYDRNGDGNVDSADLQFVLSRVGSQRSDPDWEPLADLDVSGNVDDRDVEIQRLGLCTPQVPPFDVPIVPELRPRAQVLLPALAYDGPLGSECTAAASVQNIGLDPAVAVLLLWDESALSPVGTCDGPSRMVCSGLIAPMASWRVGPETLAESASGIVFSVSGSKTLADLGQPGAFTPVSHAICGMLQESVLSDCAEYARFKAAWDAGSSFDGLPLAQARGGQLTSEVRKQCLSDEVPDSSRGGRSAYRGIQDVRYAEVETDHGYSYNAAGLYHERAGFNAVAYIQNAGSSLASVEMWMQPTGSCAGGEQCETIEVQPGEVVLYDPRNEVSDCIPPGWMGGALLRSEQPLAIVFEWRGRGGRMSAAVQPDAATDSREVEESLPVGLSLHAPLIFDQNAAWDSGVNVQNLSLERSARVDYTFVDAQGVPFWETSEVVCPGGMSIVFSPVMSGDEAPRVPGGSVYVVSRPLGTATAGEVAPLGAYMSLLGYSDAARTEVRTALTYPFVPTTKSDVPLLALPEVLRRPDESQSTELYLSNAMDWPGRTEYIVRFVDASGRAVAEVEGALASRATSVLTLDMVPGLPADFRGSAVISATYWDHALPGSIDGDETRVSLAAAAVTAVEDDDGGSDRGIVLASPLVELPEYSLQWPNEGLTRSIGALLLSYYDQEAVGGDASTRLAPVREADKALSAKDPDSLWEVLADRLRAEGIASSTACRSARDAQAFRDCTGARLSWSADIRSSNPAALVDELPFETAEAIVQNAGHYALYHAFARDFDAPEEGQYEPGDSRQPRDAKRYHERMIQAYEWHMRSILAAVLIETRQNAAYQASLTRSAGWLLSAYVRSLQALEEYAAWSSQQDRRDALAIVNALTQRIWWEWVVPQPDGPRTAGKAMLGSQTTFDEQLRGDAALEGRDRFLYDGRSLPSLRPAAMAEAPYDGLWFDADYTLPGEWYCDQRFHPVGGPDWQRCMNLARQESLDGDRSPFGQYYGLDDCSQRAGHRTNHDCGETNLGSMAEEWLGTYVGARAGLSVLQQLVAAGDPQVPEGSLDSRSYDVVTERLGFGVAGFHGGDERQDDMEWPFEQDDGEIQAIRTLSAARQDGMPQNGRFSLGETDIVVDRRAGIVGDDWARSGQEYPGAMENHMPGPSSLYGAVIASQVLSDQIEGGMSPSLFDALHRNHPDEFETWVWLLQSTLYRCGNVQDPIDPACFAFSEGHWPYPSTIERVPLFFDPGDSRLPAHLRYLWKADSRLIDDGLIGQSDPETEEDWCSPSPGLAFGRVPVFGGDQEAFLVSEGGFGSYNLILQAAGAFMRLAAARLEEAVPSPEVEDAWQLQREEVIEPWHQEMERLAGDIIDYYGPDGIGYIPDAENVPCVAGEGAEAAAMTHRGSGQMSIAQAIAERAHWYSAAALWYWWYDSQWLDIDGAWSGS